MDKKEKLQHHLSFADPSPSNNNSTNDPTAEDVSMGIIQHNNQNEEETSTATSSIMDELITATTTPIPDDASGASSQIQIPDNAGSTPQIQIVSSLPSTPIEIAIPNPSSAASDPEKMDFITVMPSSDLSNTTSRTDFIAVLPSSDLNKTATCGSDVVSRLLNIKWGEDDQVLVSEAIDNASANANEELVLRREDEDFVFELPTHDDEEAIKTMHRFVTEHKLIGEVVQNETLHRLVTDQKLVGDEEVPNVLEKVREDDDEDIDDPDDPLVDEFIMDKSEDHGSVEKSTEISKTANEITDNKAENAEMSEEVQNPEVSNKAENAEIMDDTGQNQSIDGSSIPDDLSSLGEFSINATEDSNESSDSTKKMYSCPFCEKKIFMSKVNYLQHMRRCHNERPEKVYKCNVEGCDMTFGKICKFKDHIESVHNTFAFPCDICGKRYRTKGILENHRDTHDAIGNYQCNVCSMFFKTKETLANHRLTHGGRKFECSECGMKFKGKNVLFQHKLTHNEKRFQCDICQKKFATKQNLENHTRIHTDSKPYNCELCETRFKRSHHLQKHLKTNLHIERVIAMKNDGLAVPKHLDPNEVFASKQNTPASTLNTEYLQCTVCGDSNIFKNEYLFQKHLKSQQHLQKLQNLQNFQTLTQQQQQQQQPTTTESEISLPQILLTTDGQELVVVTDAGGDLMLDTNVPFILQE